MKLLLDTHIWLWSHLAPERLGKKVSAALRSTGSELWLSPVSVWELLLLVEKGRVTLTMPAAAWIEAAWSVAPMNDAPLTRAIAMRSREIEVPHEDPADRFIAATAAVHDLTLVTADQNLLSGKGYRTLSSR